MFKRTLTNAISPLTIVFLMLSGCDADNNPDSKEETDDLAQETDNADEDLESDSEASSSVVEHPSDNTEEDSESDSEASSSIDERPSDNTEEDSESDSEASSSIDDPPSDNDSKQATDTDIAVDDESPTGEDVATDTAEEAPQPAQPEEKRSELAYETAPDISDEDYALFIDGINAFGFDLMGQTVDGRSNFFFSPVSMAVALAMTYAGARGATAAQMESVMHSSLSQELFHKANNRLQLDLESRNIAPYTPPHAEGEQELTLKLVNAIWAAESYSFLEEYLDLLSVNYDTGVNIMDFEHAPDESRLTINDWVATNTNDKIKDLLGQGSITKSTRLVLTNATYFFGSWYQSFEERATEDESFYTLDNDELTVPMMHQTAIFYYAEGENYQMVNLPYEGLEVSMAVVLPKDSAFTQVRDEVDATWLNEALYDQPTSSSVQLSLPKFSFTWGSESFKNALKALGMIDPFGAADFSGITQNGNLLISDVIHQAFIAVDENGTEAAAATAIVMDDADAEYEEPDPVIMTVDHPFLFFIRDASGIILFSGQVLNPLS